MMLTGHEYAVNNWYLSRHISSGDLKSGSLWMRPIAAKPRLMCGPKVGYRSFT